MTVINYQKWHDLHDREPQKKYVDIDYLSEAPSRVNHVINRSGNICYGEQVVDNNNNKSHRY